MYGRTAQTIVFPGHTHEFSGAGDLPFFAEARAEAAFDLMQQEEVGGFTLRHARIPAEAASEFTERLMALSLEFASHPRSGTREYALLIGVFPTHRPVAPPEAET
jgi:hypothetical protein